MSTTGRGSCFWVIVSPLPPLTLTWRWPPCRWVSLWLAEPLAICLPAFYTGGALRLCPQPPPCCFGSLLSDGPGHSSWNLRVPSPCSGFLDTCRLHMAASTPCSAVIRFQSPRWRQKGRWSSSCQCELGWNPGRDPAHVSPWGLQRFLLGVPQHLP